MKDKGKERKKYGKKEKWNKTKGKEKKRTGLTGKQ